MKIDNTPQAIVASVGIVAVSGVIAALVFAGWSEGAIIAFATLATTIVTGQYVNARKASQVEAKTDQQTAMLDTVVRQTNGASTAQLQDVAERTAAATVRRMTSTDGTDR